jgi:DNA-binding XRE family transcriptional regulator
MGAKKDLYTRRITLDKLLLNLKGNLVKIPNKGWISEIRQLIGIRSEQLAKRVGITQSSMSRLEESERGTEGIRAKSVKLLRNVNILSIFLFI